MNTLSETGYYTCRKDIFLKNKLHEELFKKIWEKYFKNLELLRIAEYVNDHAKKWREAIANKPPLTEQEKKKIAWQNFL